MEVFKRINGEMEFTESICKNKIQIELENDKIFEIYEEYGELTIRKIDGSILINPQVSNVIRLS